MLGRPMLGWQLPVSLPWALLLMLLLYVAVDLTLRREDAITAAISSPSPAGKAARLQAGAGATSRGGDSSPLRSRQLRPEGVGLGVLLNTPAASGAAVARSSPARITALAPRPARATGASAIIGTASASGKVRVPRRLIADVVSGSSTSAAREEHAGHQHDAMLFLLLAITLGTGITHLTTLPMLQGLQQTVVMFVLGVGFSLFLEGLKLHRHLGVFGRSYNMWMEIDPHLLLFTMLPALLAGDAMKIDTTIARRVARQCIFLAGPGVLMNGFLAALFLWWYLPYEWSFLLSLTTGAILCATDPVAVVSLLKELGAPATLTVQIQGESLLNDGTAIVLYTLAYNMLRGEHYDVSEMVLFMVKTTGGACCLGLVIGWVFLVWIHVASNKVEHHADIIQMSLSLCCAYVSFIMAEGVFNLSGVLSTVASALVLADRMWPVITCKESMETVWHMFEYLGNVVIFFLAGALTGRTMTQIQWVDYAHLLVIYLVLAVIRFCMFIISLPALRYFQWKHDQALTVADTMVMTWGGLRGAVGLALAISVRVKKAGGAVSDVDADRVLFYVGGVALLTLVVNATTCPALVKFLQVTMMPEAKAEILLMIRAQLNLQLQDKIKLARNRQIMIDNKRLSNITSRMDANISAQRITVHHRASSGLLATLSEKASGFSEIVSRLSHPTRPLSRMTSGDLGFVVPHIPVRRHSSLSARLKSKLFTGVQNSEDRTSLSELIVGRKHLTEVEEESYVSEQSRNSNKEGAREQEADADDTPGTRADAGQPSPLGEHSGQVHHRGPGHRNASKTRWSTMHRSKSWLSLQESAPGLVSNVLGLFDYVKKEVVNDMSPAAAIVQVYQSRKDRYERIKKEGSFPLLGELPPVPQPEVEAEMIRLVELGNSDEEMQSAMNESLLALVYSQYWAQIDEGEFVTGTNEAEILLTSAKLAMSSRHTSLVDYPEVSWYVRSSFDQMSHFEAYSPVIRRTNSSSAMLALTSRPIVGRHPPSRMLALVSSLQFNLFIMLTIIANAVVVIVEEGAHEDESKYGIGWLVADISFALIFTIEFLLKFHALGLKYFRSSWNLLDSSLMILALFSVTIDMLVHQLSVASDGNVVDGIVPYIRIARVMRMLRLLRVFRLLGFWQVLRARLLKRAFSTRVAERIQKITILVCFMRAHVRAQKLLRRFFFGDADGVNTVEAASSILQSQTAVYEAFALASQLHHELEAEENHQQDGEPPRRAEPVASSVGSLRSLRAFAVELEAFAMRACRLGVLTVREVDTIVHPLREQIRACNEGIKESHFGLLVPPPKEAELAAAVQVSRVSSRLSGTFSANSEQSTPSSAARTLGRPSVFSSTEDELLG